MLSRVFALLVLLAPLALPAQVRLWRDGEQVNVAINDKAFTTFYFGPEAAKPYLHPLRSATGVQLTRGFPMEIVPGEDTSDLHHHAMWFGHGDVNGGNFWEEGPGKGRIVLRTLGKLVNGKESGSLSTEFEWRNGDGKALLHDARTMTFMQIGGENIVDFEITFKPAGDERVTFGDSKNGSFAIRVIPALSEPNAKCPSKCSGAITNSEGGKGEKEVWGKRANWVDFSGTVDDQKWGIAVFDSPKNPKHPAFWHSRAYGLLAANPFGEREFSGDKKSNGSVTIEPGKSLTFRYRVVIHPGDPVSARIAQQYQKWSEKQ
jgi:hypothetical protein